MDNVLPAIPAKRYFTIGEVSELCGVKPYVLRYWEQEFVQLKPMKRRGNRRYYQHHEVLLIRRIRELLYEEGFTINGARNRLNEAQSDARDHGTVADGAAAWTADPSTPTGKRTRKAGALPGSPASVAGASRNARGAGQGAAASLEVRQWLSSVDSPVAPSHPVTSVSQLRDELESIRQLLGH